MERIKATQQVERIVRAIEDNKIPAKVREFYVFGSYVRGALNPDDLDVILIHDPAPELLAILEAQLVAKYGKSFLGWPTLPTSRFNALMAKSVRRPGEKIRILLGETIAEVEKMGDKIAEAEKVLIWSESNRDWQSMVNSIKPDPAAGRKERPEFARIERFNCDLQTMINLTEAIKQKAVCLTRIDAIGVEAKLNPIYQRWHDHWLKCEVMGKQSLKLLPYGMWWMQNQ